MSGINRLWHEARRDMSTCWPFSSVFKVEMLEIIGLDSEEEIYKRNDENNV